MEHSNDILSLTMHSSNNNTAYDSLIHQRITRNDNHEIRSVISNWELKNNEKSSPISSKMSTKRKRIMWKPKTSILTEDALKTVSPITKRLYSLVNTNFNVNSTQSETNPTDFNYVKNFDSIIENNSDNQNHNKLRGFLKQISAEKSGLPVIPSKDNVITVVPDALENNVLLLKPSMNSVVSTAKWQPKPYNIQDNFVNNKASQDQRQNDNIIIDCNVNSSNDVITNSKLHSVIEMSDVEDVDGNDQFDSDLIHDNENRKYLDNFVSADQTVNDSNSSKDYFLKLNSVFKKLTRNKEKGKTKNMKLKSCKFFNLSVEETSTNKPEKISVNSILLSDDNGASNFYKQQLFARSNSVENIEYNCEIVSESQHALSSCIDSKLRIPNDRGDIDGKRKLNFTKRLFRLFSQPGVPNESKKDKLLQSISALVTDKSMNNLINLITILSVELIMTTFKANDKVRESPISKLDFKSKSSGSNTVSACLSDDFSPRGSSIGRFVLKEKLRNNAKVKEKDNSDKKAMLCFDLNGRLIREDGATRSQTGHSYSNHTSWSNLYNSRLQSSLKSARSSTLSIPSRYNRENTSSKLSKIAFNSKEKEPLKFKLKSSLSNKLTEKVLSENVSKKALGDGHKSAKKTRQKSTASIFKNNVNISRLESNAASLVNNEDQVSFKKIQLEMIENGGYKMAIPIVSTLDFIKLNDIFLLKDDLYNKCDKSSLYVRPKESISKDKVSPSAINGSWFLHIESPTAEALTRSLQLTSNRFPEWNIKSYIEN